MTGAIAFRRASIPTRHGALAELSYACTPDPALIIAESFRWRFGQPISSRFNAARTWRGDRDRTGQSGPGGAWQYGHHGGDTRPGIRAMTPPRQ